MKMKTKHSKIYGIKWKGLDRNLPVTSYIKKDLLNQYPKLPFKILQARLQHFMNPELPDVQGGFRKGRGTRDQIANICWIIKKATEFQISALLTMPKPLTV